MGDHFFCSRFVWAMECGIFLGILDRHAIIAALREIAALLSLEGANKFKARAFDRGARALEASREPLELLLEQKRLTDLPGIGAALAHQIEELHRTGRSELLESLRTGLPSGVLELSQVGGIGLHALKTLHAAGIGTIAELRAAVTEGRLDDVKGFGEKRAQKIQRAIERYETAVPVITLPEGLRLADTLREDLATLPAVRSVHLAGTLRRFHELSTELAFVVETEDPAAVIAALPTLPRAAANLHVEENRVRFRLPDGKHVEVLLAHPRELPTTLAFATSAPAHFEALAARASPLLLSRRALIEDGRALVLADERALYTRLGLAFVPEELREGTGEIERASKKAFELVTAADIQGFVHCHSTWSDGNADIETMARAAEARGMSFITITDHSASAHYAGGLDVDRLRQQWDEIARVQEKVKIRILRGSEVDILADGALDFPSAVLEQLDVVIASIHNRHKLDESKMTARVLRAMRHPLFKIWGHPLGRLVPSRPPIPLRMEEVLDAIAESRAAIEISGDPARLDLEPRWARAARERGIRFVLGVDAHSTSGLDNLKYAVGLARRAGVRASDVLNARSAEAFAEAVRPGVTLAA